jgi:predicted O-linked N-acetylglucosamine transferase (SPINDLY family)
VTELFLRLIKSFRCSRRESRIRELLARGVKQQQKGDLDAAIKSYGSALALDARHLDALCLAGNAMKLAGRLDQATATLRTAVEAAPDSVEARLLLASVLRLPEGGSELIATLRELLDICRDDEQLRLNHRLAMVLRETGDHAGAVSHFRRALDVHGDGRDLQIHAQIANLLHAAGRAEEARHHYAEAWHVDGNDAHRLKRVTVIPPVAQSRDHIDRIRSRLMEEAGALLAGDLRSGEPEKDIGHTDFYLAYHGLDERPPRELLARMYLTAYPGLAYRSPHLAEAARRRGGKLRVGIISMYLSTHTIGRLMLGLFRNLRCDAFAVTAFVPAPVQDDITREILSHCDHVVVLASTLPAARQSIADEKLDVLLYTDVGMEPFTYFLTYARLAPVQCVTWGHPVTTGTPEMDYFVSSALAEPDDGAAHYSEELECLPVSCAHVCYAPPTPPLPAPDRGRFGLKPAAHLYFCPQTLFKVHPDFDDMIGNILRADPAGELLLINHPPHLRSQVEERWAAPLADVLPRIRFLPACGHEDFLGLLALADVVLDTPHFSGGLSSLETLAMGTPVVTLPGPYLRARLTLACYRRMEMMDCVAGSASEYVDMAVNLAADPAYRAEVRDRIIEGGRRLYNDVRTVRAWEAFFDRAVTRARERAAS